MSETELPEVSKEFCEESQKIKQKTPKKGGPYSKHDKESRQNEVYKLHFEYGYSARKISELMKVNRNTINGDIQYWYSKIIKSINMFDPQGAIMVNIERLELQRTRLREQLDKTANTQEKITIERLILDIDYKILNTYQKLANSNYEVHSLATKWLNDHMKKDKKDERYMTFFDTISVSRKAQQRINQIIKEDRVTPHFR